MMDGDGVSGASWPRRPCLASSSVADSICFCLPLCQSFEPACSPVDGVSRTFVVSRSKEPVEIALPFCALLHRPPLFAGAPRHRTQTDPNSIIPSAFLLQSHSRGSQ
jgi:hypothetical protein